MINKFLENINNFFLNVVGAGGAVWSTFFAIPNTAINTFCKEDACDNYYDENLHMFIVMTLALLATLNAGHQEYKPKPKTHSNFIC